MYGPKTKKILDNNMSRKILTFQSLEKKISFSSNPLVFKFNITISTRFLPFYPNHTSNKCIGQGGNQIFAKLFTILKTASLDLIWFRVRVSVCYILIKECVVVHFCVIIKWILIFNLTPQGTRHQCNFACSVTFEFCCDDLVWRISAPPLIFKTKCEEDFV